MDKSDSRDRLRQVIDGVTDSPEGSTSAYKSRYDALAPISRLPPEILAAIFAFLPPSAWNKEAGKLTWIYITHVCHRWRETALSYPLLWSRINFNKLAPAGTAELLAWAKMAPLHLKADTTKFSMPQLDTFEGQLEAHISNTRYLSISGDLQSVLKRLLSDAPILEFLSLSRKKFLPNEAVIPVDLFNHTAPNLTSLKLSGCGISWKSPLLKGLRTLKIQRSPADVRPKLEDWLDGLNEMTQLETFILQSAAPLASLPAPLIPEPSRAVTLPSLTRFEISASAEDCALALAHLVLPALTWLHVDAESYEREAGDVQLLIPYVARNIHGLQDIEPLRSILISGERIRVEVLAWTIPDADVKVWDPDTFLSASAPVCLMFAATDRYCWLKGMDAAIFGALLTLLPVNSVSTFTAQNHTRLSKEFWLSHAPRWPLLEQARLVSTAVKAFRDMLAEDSPPDRPRLPSLTKLILVDVNFTADRTYDLRDMLIGRVEQGVPLEALDLRTCAAPDCAIELLREIVVDMQEPLAPEPMTMEKFFYSHRGYFNEGDYDNGEYPWYDNVDSIFASDSEPDYNDVYHDDSDSDSEYNPIYDSD